MNTSSCLVPRTRLISRSRLERPRSNHPTGAASGCSAVTSAMLNFSADMDVQRQGCYALLHLANCHAANQTAIVSAGGFSVILSALMSALLAPKATTKDQRTIDRVLAHGTQALRSLLVDHPVNQRLLAQADATAALGMIAQEVTASQADVQECVQSILQLTTTASSSDPASFSSHSLFRILIS
jgi:hypothetical protein